jgi:hypothetical protein
MGCEATECGGLGLCANHLNEWLRSPERRGLPDHFGDAQWDAALESFILRKTSEVAQAARVTANA